MTIHFTTDAYSPGVRLLIAAFVTFTSAAHLRMLWLAAASRRWPFTIGKVESAQVAEYRDDESRDYLYAPKVSYVYRVDGVPFRSTRVRFVRRGTYEETLDDLHGIQAGRDVRVYFDPRDPESCVLLPGGRYVRLWVSCHVLGLAAVYWMLAGHWGVAGAPPTP